MKSVLRRELVICEAAHKVCEISLLLFKDGADLSMDKFSSKQSSHALSLGANGFIFLKTSHLMLKLIFFVVVFFLISKRVR